MITKTAQNLESYILAKAGKGIRSIARKIKPPSILKRRKKKVSSIRERLRMLR